MKIKMRVLIALFSALVLLLAVMLMGCLGVEVRFLRLIEGDTYTP